MDYGDSLVQRFRPARVGRRLAGDARRLVAPVTARIVPLRHELFELDGRSFPYLVHPFNVTWRNERSVEIPVAIEFLSKVSGVGLEFGNVLGHYGVEHGGTVVDKYDRARNVVHVDVVDYRPDVPLDWIVSISTLEHVGRDEQPRDDAKALRALEGLRAALAPAGRMFLTVPFGHNPLLDGAILSDQLSVLWQACLVKDDGRWHETSSIEWRPYGQRDDTGAGAVWLAEIGPG